MRQYLGREIDAKRCVEGLRKVCAHRFAKAGSRELIGILLMSHLTD